MSFEEMERRYRELRKQQKRGEMSAEQLAQAVVELRLQDKDGFWWQIRPSDGAWLRWGGSAWEEARPQHKKEVPGPPQTLVQFLRLLFRSLLHGLRRKLILAGIVAVGTWILHTYLLVGPNGGFAPGTNRTLDMVLALRDRVLSGTLFWALLAALVTTAIARLRRVGLRQAASEVRSAPGWLWEAVRSAGPIARPLLLFGGAALALLAGTLMDHRLIVLQLALAGAGILIVRQQSVLWTVLRLGWIDLQRLLRRDDTSDLNVAWLGAGTLGATLGMLGAALQPFAPYGGLAGVVLLLGIGAYLLVRARKQTGAGRLLSLLLLLGLLALLATPVFADDGGWSEGGGNLAGWLSSPGAGRAVAMGLLPAAGASLGVLLGSMFGSLAGISLALDTSEAPAARRRRKSATARAPSPEPAETAADSAARTARRQEERSREGPAPAAEPLPEEAPPTAGATEPTQAARRTPGQEEVAEPGPPRRAAKREAAPQAGPQQTERVDEVAEEDAVPRAETSQEAVQAEGPSRSGRPREPQEAPGRRGPESGPEKPGKPPEAGPSRRPQGPSAEEVEQVLSDEEAGQAEQAARQPPAEEQTAEPGQPRQAAKPDPQSQAGTQQSERSREAEQAEAPSRGGRARGGRPEEPGRRGPQEAVQETGKPPEPTPSRRPAAPTAEEVERTLGDEEAGRAEATQPQQAAQRPPAEEKTAEPWQAQQAAKRTPSSEGKPQQAEQGSSTPEGRSQQVTRPEKSGATQGQPTSKQGEGPEEAPEGEAADVAGPGDTATTLPGIAAALEENPWQVEVVEVAGGREAGRRYILGERTHIGRADNADVQLHDARVSRRHAVVEQVGEAYQITDLESANGTFVNGRRITEPTDLRPGDAIRIGRSELVVRA